MSKRLHLHTTHVIRYADFSHFNYQQKEVFCLLSSIGVDVCDNSEYGYGDEIEIKREELYTGLEVLSQFVNSGGSSVSVKGVFIDDIEDCLCSLYGNDEHLSNAVSFMGVIDLWLKNAPENADYIHLTWF